MTLSIKTGGIKFMIGWMLVFLIRLIPFRPANFEPMLSVIMPFTKRYNLFSSFLFGFLGIAVFDVVGGQIGVWTLVTAAAYGLLGAGSYFFFRQRKGSLKNYLAFGILGTIAYDAATGLSIGPLFFGQPLAAALFGQIPFTLMHLFGTITFVLLLTPLVEKWLVANETLEIFILRSKTVRN